ncbi:MAG: MBL fold metallo-hydrolase [Chloroflexi bacterium]|nr:MBL fold metallo-hydrolase [Chloroflexota bacterium]
MADNIFWLGHDSFRLTGERVVYIDPWKLAPGAAPADLVLVTHDHYDHLSKDDIAKISKPGTVVVGPQSVADKLGGNITVVKAGDRITAAGVPIEVVAAYNPNKKFHPKSAGYVGYIITLNGKRIYHTGDTDLIPEMAQIKSDIALLPVSGTYVMTAAEAAEAANTLKPALAIPMHYGDPDVVGTRRDADEFKRLTQVPVEILEKSK